MVNKRLDIGVDFGDYRVVRLLGTSGRVDAYLMKSRSDGGFFAMKTFLPPDGVSEDFRERFAGVVEKLIHAQGENIVQIHDFGEDPDSGLLYLLMDYVDGGTLAEYIAANGPLSPADALKTALVCAYALESLHAAGIVHGGVTTNNMMLMQDGTLKLADADMAKVSPRASLLCADTFAGEIPAHLAPEQILSDGKVDSRTDVYSLGIALFEMLTAKRPDAVPSVLEYIVKSTNNELVPDVRTIRADIPAAAANVVAKLCAVEADQRPKNAASAAELILAAIRDIGGFDDGEDGYDVEEKGGASSCSGVGAASPSRKRLKLRRVKVTQPATRPAFSDDDARDGDGGGICKLVVLLLVLAIAAAAFFFWHRTRADAENGSAAVEAAAEDITDATVRSAKVGDFTWFYTLEHSKAVLWRGQDEVRGNPCVEPEPIGRVAVPESIDGYEVVALGALAFADCQKLESVVLPNGLERIGNRAFLRCIALESVVLPPKVKTIGKWAYNSCESMTRFDLANCEYLEDGGGNFAFCPKLREFFVAQDNPAFKSVAGVLYSADGKRLVAYPAAVKTVEIPENVEEIGEFAFCESAAANIAVPPSVSRIGQGAFKNCRELKNLDFTGDAPRILEGRDAIFKGASRRIAISCRKGKGGWPDNGAAWPNRDGRTVNRLFPEFSREWCDAKGRRREAAFVGIAENGTVAIMRNPGEDRVRSLTVAKLCPDDQAFIASVASQMRSYEKRNGHYGPVE